MARRIQVYPYRIPASPSGYHSTRSQLYRFVSASSLARKRHLVLPVLVCAFLVYHYYRHSSLRDHLVRIAPALVDDDLARALALRPHNDSHSRVSLPGPALPSDDPAFAFRPRRPCNDLTVSLSLPPLANASALSPALVPWLSPSPPLASTATLRDRLADFLESPLSSDAVHVEFNSQTCSSPSIAYNTNKLHQRENVDFWRGLEMNTVEQIRQDAANVLIQAEHDGTLNFDRNSPTKRGLVWTAGNADTFDRVLVSLRLLRNTYDCRLPAEIFHFSSESPSEGQRLEFAALNATPVALSTVEKQASGDRTKSFHIKGSAFTRSSFDEVLYLDSDSVPARDPSFLFDSPEFRRYGAVFWGDYWKDTRENAIWRILGVQCRDEWTMESGQVLVDKARHLDALLLVEHWLKDWRFWFRFSDGDKDLLRYAFLLLRKRWSIPSHTLASASWSNPDELGEANRARFAGHTMVQFGLASEFEDARGGRECGRPLFVHGNLLKRIAGTFGGNGQTWGRTLHVALPRPDRRLAASDAARRDRSDPNSDPSPRQLEMECALGVDDQVNVSPFTGFGIARSCLPHRSSTGPPLLTAEPDDTIRKQGGASLRLAAENLSRRLSGLLSRGIRTEFWDGHRNWAYVLGIQLSWVDELEGIDFGASSSSSSVSNATLTASDDEDRAHAERGEWERWVVREERAECSKRYSIRDAVRSTIRGGQIRENEEGQERERERGPQGDEGFMEIVDWSNYGELRTFEQRFYDAGGKANGNGF